MGLVHSSVTLRWPMGDVAAIPLGFGGSSMYGGRGGKGRGRGGGGEVGRAVQTNNTLIIYKTQKQRNYGTE